ncbi:MAG: CapA family protein, partial [Firmicutes bacterium]|nr:CapA family protein [Bacillota bacterium]
MSKKKYKINIARLAVMALIVICFASIALHFIPQIFKPKCEHVYGTDGLCTLCGEECVHEFAADGHCSICGKECEHQFGEDRICTVCGMVKPDEILNLTIIAGGDVMAHGGNIESAYQNDGSYFYSTRYQCYSTDGSFDFRENYQYVKPYIESADLALINVETTFSGGSEYSGYWGYFNAPD